MPLDPVNDFSQCIQEFIDKGDSPELAKSRCGAIKADMEQAHASILKKHTGDLPCMCSMLQTATADFFIKDGVNYASFFLLNTEMNLKRWAVTAESLPKYLKSFKGKPFISEPELGHFGADDMPVHEVVAMQEDFRVGDIVDVKLDEKTMTASAIVKFHKTKTAERIWNEIQNGKAIYVSPAIAGYAVSTAEGDVYHEWYGLHLARVGSPAYGVFHASLKRTCTGDERMCVNSLIASAMADSSDLKKNTSELSSFKQNTKSTKQMAEKIGGIKEDEKQKGVDNPKVGDLHDPEEDRKKLEEENASMKKELASLKKGTAQLEEVAQEVTQLKDQLAVKEEEEITEIVAEIMQIKEEIGVETVDTEDTTEVVETVEEETASLKKQSLASLKEKRSFLQSVATSVVRRLDTIEGRSSSRIVKTPEIASASGNANTNETKIDMNYIKRLTA